MVDVTRRGKCVPPTSRLWTGDWMQAVCERCYGFLVHEHREKAKKAAAKRRPVEAKQQQWRQLEKERRQLQRQLTGLDSLLAFFRVAGVRAELVGGRRPWIDGAQTEPLA